MDKRLEKIKADMCNKYGMNAIRVASEITEELYRIPSGSISLDIAIGGGIPVGRMTHLCGDFSAGKSALAYHIITNFQNSYKKSVKWDEYYTEKNKAMKELLCPKEDKEGSPLLAALIQFESNSYANDWAADIGIDINKLIVNEPDGLEEGIDIMASLQREHGVDLIVVDSYAAASPTGVLSKETADTHQMGLKQKKLEELHGKYQANNNKRSRTGIIPCTLLALNQLRDKIGGFGFDMQFAPGGRSKDFTMAVEIRLRKGDFITIGTGDNKEIIGQVTKFKIQKNKTATPFKTGSYDFYFAEGGPVPAGCIDNAKELVVEGVAFSVIERRGAWFYYNGKQLGQGLDNALAFLRENNEVFEEIKAHVMRVAFEDEEDQPKVADEKVVGVAEETGTLGDILNLGDIEPSKPAKKTMKKKGSK